MSKKVSIDVDEDQQEQVLHFLEMLNIEGKDKKIKNTAEFNSSLQGAYFIMATRSAGLDCCPMLGFSKERLNQDFFPGGKNKAIFICGIGYGDHSKLYNRAPRLEFNQACSVM